MLKVPPDRLPAGPTQETFQHHELGHAAVGIAEGIKSAGIISHNHPLLKKEPSVAGGAQYQEEAYVLDFDHELKYTPAEILTNTRKWATIYLGGAAANDLIDGIELEKNAGVVNDMSAVRGLLECHLKMTPEEANREIAAAYIRAKRHLQDPGVIDRIKEDAITREADLPDTYHHSADRLNRSIGSIDESENGKTVSLLSGKVWKSHARGRSGLAET